MNRRSSSAWQSNRLVSGRSGVRIPSPAPSPRRDRPSTACRIAGVLPQIIVDPSVTPTLNNGGWVYNAAVLLAVLGAIVALALVFGYMRFAPRFQTDESARRSVRAPRIQPGRDVRRPVNVTSAPVVVQPPTVVGVAAPVAAAAAPQAAPAAPQAAPAAPQAAPAAAPAAPTVSDQTAAAPGAAATPAAQPAAEAASAASSPTPAAPVAASTEERPEVSLDEETFEKTLAELIAKGTDRRVAEGQARRAAMIAARKKAGG